MIVAFIVRMIQPLCRINIISPPSSRRGIECGGMLQECDEFGAANPLPPTKTATCCAAKKQAPKKRARLIRGSDSRFVDAPSVAPESGWPCARFAAGLPPPVRKKARGTDAAGPSLEV
ncbi:MAG: hypothetical protein ACK4U0_18690 [Mesorhizobium sp.]